MQFLFGFLFFILAIYGFTLAAGILHLRKIRWHSRKNYFPVQDKDVLPDMPRLLNGTNQKLTELGFQSEFWVFLRSPYSRDEGGSYHQILYHPEYRTHAAIALHPLPETGRLITVDFLTFQEDERVIYTSNGTFHFMGVHLEGYDWVDPYTPSMEEQWRAHHQRLDRDHTQSALKLNAESFCQWGDRFLQQYETELAHRGDMKKVQADSYQLTLLGCWRVIRRLQGAGQSLKTMVSNVSNLSGDEHRPEIDAIAHERQEANTASVSTGYAGKLLLLLVSAALFLMSFGYRMDIEALFILLGVLFFHELGHIAAMRLFGYRDLKILFIPFLGAVATGKKSSCSAWQSAVIYIAGPLPGIILAGILWGYAIGADTSWMPLLIALLFFVNFFNLLPVQPLDGGQLANVLLFQRWPKLQIVFHGVSMTAFMVFAWFVNEPLMAGLGFLLAFMMLYQYREARLASHVREHFPDINDAPRIQRLAAIYQGIKQLNFTWAYTTRMQAAKNVVERLSNPLPSARESLVGMTLYMLFLFGTPAVFASLDYTPVTHWLHQYDQYEEPDWEAEIERATTPEERAAILNDASDYAQENGVWDDALAYNERAISLLMEAGLEDTEEMANALFLEAKIAFDFNEHDQPFSELAGTLIPQLTRAIDLYKSQQQSQKVIQQLAVTYDFLSYMQSMHNDPESALKSLDAAKNYLVKLSGSQEWQLAANLQKQAELLADMNKWKAAEQRYLASLEWTGRINGQPGIYQTQMLLRRLVEFYLNQSKFQDALDAADTYYAQAEGEDGFYGVQLAEMQAWANYKLVRYSRAEADFEIAIERAHQRNLDNKYSGNSYDEADNIGLILLVHHSDEAISQQDSRQNRTANDVERLLAELDRIGRTLEDYKKHLDCECSRNKRGYEADRNERLREVVNLYLPQASES